MFQVTRLSDYLSYPLPDRIRVYTNIIETASIKDLQVCSKFSNQTNFNKRFLTLALGLLSFLSSKYFR